MPKCVKPSSSKNLFHMSQLFVLIMNVDELALEHVLDPACFASTWSPLMPYDALSNALGTKANEKHEIIALESADSSGVPCASIANIWTLPDFPSEYELFPGFPALEPENSLEPNEPLNLPDLDNLGIMESVQECVTTQDGNLIHIDEWPSHNLPSRELEIVRKSGSSIKAKKRKKNPRNTPKTTRRSIQPGVIEFLEAQFDQNPYPSKADMESFSLSQGVLPKTVRNWFCNTRSRRDPTQHRCAQPASVMTVSEDAHISENAFQEAEPFTVSSPAPSNLSIERYLASSPDEEMASPEAIEANIQAALEENSALERNTFKSPNLTAAGSVCAEVTEEPLNVPTTFKYLTDSLLDHRANAWKNALSKYTTLPSQVDVDDTTADIHSESLLRDQRETSSQSMMGDANSDTTNGSCMSLVSNASFVSMDSRGSRRGRRRWNRPPGSQKTQNLDGTAGPIPGAAHNLYQHKLQFHCTFPGCGRIFDNEYEWNRHEYSIHYPQIEWICCKNLDIDALLYRALLECSLYSLDFEKFRTCLQKFINYEFAGCKHEIEADRTFFRKDQFIQHLNICHLKHFPNACFQEDFFEDDEQKKLILNGLRKVFAETWERLKAYPSAEAAGLYCSACSQTLNSWEERKSHFSRHFKDGIHVWSSPIDAQRECTVFVPLIRKVSTGKTAFACSWCGETFSSHRVALEQHLQCSTWSCAYISDYSSIFRETEYGGSHKGNVKKNDVRVVCCALCDSKWEQLGARNGSLENVKREHFKSHWVKNCGQDVYSNPNDLLAHLKTHEGVKYALTVFELAFYGRRIAKSSLGDRIPMNGIL